MSAGNFSTQAKNIWGSLGMGPKVTLFAFVGGLVLLLVVLGLWAAQPDYVLLYGGLSPEDAAAMTTRLSDDKVPFKYEASRGAILVSAARADAARLSLAAQGLPKNATEGFELFDKSTFGTTEFVQRVNYIRALQGTLARNIQAIEGVESARVTLSVPEDEVFARDKKEAKASVVVRLRNGRSLGGDQVGAIRHLIASSVPKLDMRNVTVIDSAGHLLSRPSGPDDAAALTGDQIGVQKNIETNLAEKVQTLLDQVVGPGQSAVRVTAQLNFERVERSTQKMDPDSGVLLEESSRNEDQNGFSGSGGSRGGGVLGGNASGVPGVAANSLNPPPVTTESTTNTKKQKTVSNRFHYDTITERIIPEVGSVKRISVAVLVAPKAVAAAAAPAAGAAPVAKAAPTPRTAKELEALTEIVRSAVGFSADRADVIKVEELPFFDNADAAGPLAPPALPSPWLEVAQRHFSDALAFLGILVMAVVFWKMFSKLSVPMAATGGSTMGETGSMTVNLPSEPGVRMAPQEELKQLVTQNNTQAVSIIRSMLK